MFRKYWILTAGILAAIIAAWYFGLFSWGVARFPDQTVHAALACIAAVFAATYFGSGMRAAKIISQAESASYYVTDWDDSPVGRVFRDALKWRQMGEQAGQTCYAPLFEMQSEKLDDILKADIEQIDSVRVFLFFLGLIVTLVGIVSGFATLQFPSNPEEAKMFSFTIIRALGLAYLPALMCIGSTLILFVLSVMLQNSAGRALARLRDPLYRITILGTATAAPPSQ